ncbi:MAG: ATPase, P-type, transporting, HAD superfamily, subfamily IC/heavy metal translocating P-type ATPase [uncultured archaeon A07HB70]|nr:MAG: ATPase, P-type, transporting, HAD superfamily, subfamily IC/heavy metal translocating P-type ATPase [uncultured archaeon A07HB70]
MTAEGPRGEADDGRQSAPGTAVRLSVPSMDCASCASKVEAALGDAEGVVTHRTDPAAGRVQVTYDPEATGEEDVVAAVEAAGYGVVPDDAETESAWRSRRAAETLVAGLLLVGGLAVAVVPGADARVLAAGVVDLSAADALFLGSVAVGGRAILANGVRSLRARSLDMDFLMSAAIVGALAASVAFGRSLYVEAATLAALFSVAELLERASVDRARSSLEELMELAPDEATVVRDGTERVVPAGDVAVGDRVVVRPGERVPTDGEVVEGSSAVDQSAVTGESVPVDVAVGDEVYAGTVAEEGYVEVRATAPASESTLARVVELVEDASAARADREQFVERFAARYTPAVVGLAAVVTLASPAVLGVTTATAVVYGLTLLVLACPCAFVIATPVSVVSGVTSAARSGVLVKGGDALEAAGAVDVVAFDKTGTLTRGELTVTDVVALNGNTEADVLRCARGVERRSEHPIGEAIVAEAGGGSGPAVDDFESITGRGVRAALDGTPHVAGEPALFADLGFDLSHVHATGDGSGAARRLCEHADCLDLLDGVVPRLQSEGKTVVLVGRPDDGEVEGVVALADEVRPEARQTVGRLRERGVETVMLTGDNERTARAVAGEVGVDDHRAGLLPAEKVAAVEELVADHDGVAMVGDGVNDAPALAAATVGVAMGAAGSDAALETADVALMADDVSRLPYLFDLSRRAVGVIRQNVAASLLVKAALVVGVPFGLVPIWLAVLAGDAGMTVGITANAARLARVRPDGQS